LFSLAQNQLRFRSADCHRGIFSWGQVSFVTQAAAAEIDRQPEAPIVGDMRTMSRAVRTLSLSLMLLVSVAALADDSVMIRLYNDGADDIVVNVYDMNAQPPEAVIFNQRINGFAWIPVSVTAGAAGNGHVEWTARTTDPDFRRCGHQEMHGVANEAMVHVSVNSSCHKFPL